MSFTYQPSFSESERHYLNGKVYLNIDLENAPDGEVDIELLKSIQRVVKDEIGREDSQFVKFDFLLDKWNEILKASSLVKIEEECTK